jgi:hypothetical protein
MIAFEADNLGMCPDVIDEASRVRASINHVTKTNDSIIRLQFEAMHQCSECTQMPVDITHSPNLSIIIQPSLQVSFDVGVPE